MSGDRVPSGTPPTPAEAAAEAFASVVTERPAVVMLTATMYSLLTDELAHLRADNALKARQLEHYKGWFGTECPCDCDVNDDGPNGCPL